MVKIGFIGCGGIARLHMSNLARIENVEIVAHTDVDIKKAEETARLYGGRAYSSYRDMLNKEDLDAVYVCTPPFAHGFEVEVVEKGVHLFVEKPVAMKIDVAKEVLRAIQRYGVINSVGYMLRYLKTTERMRRMASESTVGMALGFYIDNFWLPPNHWVLDKDKSGGQLVEHTTHVFDLARYVVGEIDTIYAELDNILLRDIPGITMENEAVVLMRFKNRAVGMIAAIWASKDTHKFIRLEVYAKDYVLEHMGRDLRVYRDGYIEEYKARLDPYFEEDRAFIEAVKKGSMEPIKCTYEDGMRTLAATIAANVAYAEKRIVKLQI